MFSAVNCLPTVSFSRDADQPYFAHVFSPRLFPTNPNRLTNTATPCSPAPLPLVTHPLNRWNRVIFRYTFSATHSDE